MPASCITRASVIFPGPLVAACGTMKTIDTSRLHSGSAVCLGDTVQVSTTDGQVLGFTITAVPHTELTGDRTAFRADEPDSGYETQRRFPGSRRGVVVPVASIRRLSSQVIDSADPEDTDALFVRGLGNGVMLAVDSLAAINLFVFLSTAG